MNQRISRRAALAAFGTSVVAGCAGPAPAPVRPGADKELIGQTVLPKQRDPIGTHTVPPPNAEPGIVYGTAMHSASWEVKSVKGTQAVLLENGVAYLLETEKLVPLSEAVEFFTKALKDEPNEAYHHNFRGWAQYLLGKHDAALADFDAFLKELAPGADPAHRSIGLTNRGLVLAEAGKFEAARKDLNAAGASGTPNVWLNYGYTHELAGEWAKAIAVYTELEGNYAEGENNLAWVRATCPDEPLRDGKSAVALARGLCERTENREGRYLDTLAAAHAETGDFKKAVEAQELALEDRGFARRYGDEATARLRLYKKEKPFHSAPRK